jgi:S1-C subfamily serine protease
MGRRGGRLAALFVGGAAGAASLLAPAPATLAPAVDFLPLPEAERVAALVASTVRIVAFGCGATSGDGSGVALADGRVLTSRHVVDGAIALSIVPEIGRASGGAAEVSGTVDAGLVRTPVPLAPGLTLAAHDPVPGDALLVAGFPLGGPLDLVDASVVDVVDGMSRGSSGPVLRLAGRMAKGMSGGPVLDSAGRVAAIVFAVEGDGYTLAIPASTLRDIVASDELIAPIRCG